MVVYSLVELVRRSHLIDGLGGAPPPSGRSAPRAAPLTLGHARVYAYRPILTIINEGLIMAM